MKVKFAQSCLTLCDLMDYTVHEILQAGILERVTFPFSRRFSQPRSPTLQADSSPAEPQGKPAHQGDEVVTNVERELFGKRLLKGTTGFRRASANSVAGSKSGRRCFDLTLLLSSDLPAPLIGSQKA